VAPPELDDDDLLARASRGNRDAFSKLYDHVMPLVFGIAKRVVRDPSQAEEVAQEAMVEVWRTAARFDPKRGSARTFIATIAHRRAVDRVRSEQASRRRDHDDARRTVAPTVDETAPDQALLTAIDKHQVRDALERLTEIQREAIVLAYYDGRTQVEVASILDVPLGTVKTRIRDGLIRLRDSMGVTA
jgi:RNA polymerase sigma-70 factor (ECF subfamily)